MIPENKQPAVHKALQKAFQVDAFEHCEQLTKGLSGALVYKMIIQGMPYLVRVITRTGRDQPAYYFDCLQAAANAGFAPKIHYLNIDDGISVTDYIEGKIFPVAEARVAMADMLRGLHKLPKFSHQMLFFETSDNFLQKFLDSNIVPLNDIKQILESYATIGKVYPRYDEENLVSCHNDVKRDNIIFDGSRPWLVDWEAARLNDRYLDLASIANFTVKNEQDETELLTRYFGETFDEYKQARFFLMSQIAHMLCFTLCSVSVSAGKPIDINRSTLSFNVFHDRLWNGEINLANPDEILHYALVHLKEFLRKMHSKRFDESLRILADNEKLH